MSLAVPEEDRAKEAISQLELGVPCEGNLDSLVSCPRGRLFLAIHGIKALCDAFRNCALATPLNKSHCAFLISVCLRLCQNDEAAVANMADHGLHIPASKLAEAFGGDDDDCAEDAIELVSRLLAARRPSGTVGCSAVRGPFSLKYTFPAVPASGAAAEIPAVTVLTRLVEERQSGHFDVGFVPWPAALILARWLHLQADALAGKRVLEIGAGVGLTGLLAAFFAAEVCLTDFNPRVLRNLERNAALNLHPGAEGVARKVAVHTGALSVRFLDWDQLPLVSRSTSLATGTATVPDKGGGPCERGEAAALASEACRGEHGAGASSGTGACRSGVKSGIRQGNGGGGNSDSCGASSDGNQDGSNDHGSSSAGGGSCGGGDSGGSDGGPDNCGGGSSRWNPSGVPALAAGGRFDVIIAADFIYQPSDAVGALRVLRNFLRPGGAAHFLVPAPRNRFGTEALPRLLAEEGWRFESHAVADLRLLDGIEEAAYHTWTRFLVHGAPQPPLEGCCALMRASRLPP